MPCSAEIDPPCLATMPCTTLVHIAPARQKFRRIGSDRLADIVVDVSVTKMTERERAGAGDQVRHGCIGFDQEIRHRGYRHRDVVLDRAALGLLCAGEMISRSFQNALR